MARLVVLADPDTSLGFQLAGVEVICADDFEGARARLLELLGDPSVGLIAASAALLDRLDAATRRRVPLAEALAPLQIAEPAREAIVEQRGPWWPLLQLACAVERHDLAEAEPLAAAHGGLDAVLAQAEAAWAWSAELARAQVAGA